MSLQNLVMRFGLGVMALSLFCPRVGQGHGAEGHGTKIPGPAPAPQLPHPPAAPMALALPEAQCGWPTGGVAWLRIEKQTAWTAVATLGKARVGVRRFRDAYDRQFAYSGPGLRLIVTTRGTVFPQQALPARLDVYNSGAWYTYNVSCTLSPSGRE